MKPWNVDEITLKNWDSFVKCRKKPMIVHACQINCPEGFEVTTRQGKVVGKPGDYLMIGQDDEKYPCDKEIFEKTYDILE